MFPIKQIENCVIAGKFCHVLSICYMSNYLLTINFFQALIIQIRLEWQLNQLTVPICENLEKKMSKSNQPFFVGEKSLDIGR